MIRVILDTQKQKSKAHVCPKEGLANTKSIKRGRAEEGQAII